MASADWGIKISKPGFNVFEAADNELVFSSTWPTLAIIKEETVPLIEGLAQVKHDAGFPAFALAWYIENGVAKKDGAVMNAPNVDSENVYVDSFNAGHDSATHVHVKVYNVDLSEDIDYPLHRIDETTPTKYDRDYGFKVTKAGKNIYSKKLEDYIIHSRCQAPSVLAVKTEQSAFPSGPAMRITYENPMNELTWAFGYVRSGTTGIYTNAPFASQAYPGMSVDPVNHTYINEYFTPFGDNGATILVLRDPLFAPTTESVSY